MRSGYMARDGKAGSRPRQCWCERIAKGEPQVQQSDGRENGANANNVLCEFMRRQPAVPEQTEPTRVRRNSSAQKARDTANSDENRGFSTDNSCGGTRPVPEPPAANRCYKLEQTVKEPSLKAAKTVGGGCAMSAKVSDICDFLRKQPAPEWTVAAAANRGGDDNAKNRSSKPHDRRCGECRRARSAELGGTKVAEPRDRAGTRPEESGICEFLKNQPAPEWTKAATAQRPYGPAAEKERVGENDLQKTRCGAKRQSVADRSGFCSEPVKSQNEGFSICDYLKNQPAPEWTKTTVGSASSTQRVTEKRPQSAVADDRSRSQPAHCQPALEYRLGSADVRKSPVETPNNQSPCKICRPNKVRRRAGDRDARRTAVDDPTATRLDCGQETLVEEDETTGPPPPPPPQQCDCGCHEPMTIFSLQFLRDEPRNDL